MDKQKSYRFETQVIHAAQSPQDWQGATLPPIYQSASHAHPTAENLSETFAGKTADHIYMRLTNPTNQVLEEKLAVLEGGQGAVVTSSGMAAVSNACMALLRAGDEFVTGNSLFMSTYLLFTKVFKKYDITARLVEPTDLTAMEEAINDKTRFIYLETIGNPKMDVPDLAEVAEIAHRHGLPLVVDNTLATPYLCRPLELGADVVIHSTTKYLSGHGACHGRGRHRRRHLCLGQRAVSGLQALRRQKGPSGVSRQGLARTPHQFRHHPVALACLPDHDRPGHPGPAHGTPFAQRHGSGPLPAKGPRSAG